jgi:HSP20 family protein
MRDVFFPKNEFLGIADGWVPCIDICERGNEILIELELPGVSQKDITIWLHSNRIEVRGVKRENVIGRNITYLRFEREYGRFRRVIALPSAIAPERTRASLANGVLAISLKKNRVRSGKDDAQLV